MHIVMPAASSDVPRSPPVAVLLIIFNRPTLTRQVFDAIRQATPPRLYIAADGPRDGVETDVLLCEQAREVVQHVDWPCEVFASFNASNKGCKAAPPEAISWFFSREECGIILEDDTVPSLSFFPFAAEMLSRFRNESRVMHVGGLFLQVLEPRRTESYVFSNLPTLWGWATWRRAWQSYDLDMKTWPENRDGNLLRRVGKGIPGLDVAYRAVLDMAWQGKIDTWDYPWVYAVWASGGMMVMPTRNLVRNVGFGRLDATHTRVGLPRVLDLPLETLEGPMVGPTRLEADLDVDRFHARHLFGVPRFFYLRRVVRRALPEWLARLLKRIVS